MKNILYVIFFTLFNFKIHASIVYDKDGVTISDIDITNYINFYNYQYDKVKDLNKILKDIVLVNKTIKYLEFNDKNYLDQIDEIINKNNNSQKINDDLILNLYRIQYLREEFIYDYFYNKLSIDDITSVLNSKNFKVSISKNNCFTISDIVSNKDIPNFNLFVLNSYKKIPDENIFFLNNQEFKACLEQSFFSLFDKELIIYMENQTKINFLKFIYEKSHKK